MLELQGIAVSPGVAIGRAMVFDREGYRITRCLVKPGDDIHEWQRLNDAIEEARQALESTQKSTSESMGERMGNIFSAQQQVLMDPHLKSELESLIRKKQYSAEYAVSEVFSRYAAVFRKSSSAFLVERVNDVRDVERLLRERLTGQPLA
ncbi:MAG: phosphoenolpyruvate-utilizing N-terminal domain-containing protein, partial [Pirellula sp.]